MTSSHAVIFFIRRLLLAAALVGPVLMRAQPAPRASEREDDPSPHSAVSWIAATSAVRPGEVLQGGIRIQLDAGWHTYWRNGGDAGLPLVVSWTFPEGGEASVPAYPLPRRLPQPPLMSYGYEHEVVFPVTIKVPKSLRPGTRWRAEADVEWLACADVCLPAAGSIAVDVPVLATAPEPTLEAAMLAEWSAGIPLEWDGNPVQVQRSSAALTITVPLPATARREWRGVYFFPDSGGLIEHASEQAIAWRGDTLLLTIPLSAAGRRRPPALVSGVLSAETSGSKPLAWQVSAPVAATIAAAVPSATSMPASSGAVGTVAVRNASSLSSVLLAALFALLGGLLLNVMPCVFPVLSLKVLSLVGEHEATAGARIRLAAGFGFGVLCALWALAAALLLLRAGGHALGWGFQMQSPAVVAALAVLLFLLGLNLSGVFEIGLAFTRIQGPSGRSARDAWLTGVLTVIVATPCSAPFMGSAIGFALVQSAFVSVVVFTALGIGLALPVMLLLSQPQWLRRLPASGPWLASFKHWLAFPMYLTLVWLLWVHAQQTSPSASAILQALLVIAAVGAWMLGQGQRAFRTAKTRIGIAVIATAWAGATWLAAPVSASPTPIGDGAAMPGDGAWMAFTPARLDSLRNRGRTVFVDYSAAWCLSCQVNERLVLDRAPVRQAFARTGVVPMRADWTARDSSITRMITAVGQAGVPLYVIYPADPDALPVVLPSVLTSTVVMDALARAVPSP